ncbi:hypothetical protein [Bradyrhizobium sp. BR 10289]|uniref:hypothetical protein n=1 Tax=Bradyrhizobium sp. BR 10289 TaxID=2749993 RepID=UPI001C64CC53|nr:hypothetical protein [Bradyrhizobium sp. BR 10289]MBW7970992.1 hypothetical protein [Bradyrhizobium sp. BR 10289]
MEYQVKHSSPQRMFRAAILNGVTPRECDRAALEALGIDTAELETRLRQQLKTEG